MRCNLLSACVALLILASAPSVQAGKFQRMAMQPVRVYSQCQANGTCPVPQTQSNYYATGQGAAYAPPTQAPVQDLADPGRALTHPVAYQQTESKPETAPTWITLSNYPGWEGLGKIDADGYVRPSKWRNASTGEERDKAPETVQAAQVQAVSYGDPYGFTNWLNGVRAQYGLGAVGCDGNLCAWAAVNNDHQNAYGMGHHVMGSARRQNSGMGASTTVFQMWMASPAHRAALLDPSISWIGIAASGAYWTFNAN